MWFLFMVFVWIVGPDGQWATWAIRAMGAAIAVAFLWTYVIRAGDDD
jgi:hypothetical protein